MFTKLIFASERDFLAIACFNMTPEFRLQSWGQMARIIMAIKVIQTAASNGAARHQADEAVWTWVVWSTRLVLERKGRTLMRRVVLLECRINRCSQYGCIGERWCRPFMAGEGDSPNIGQGMSRGWKSGDSVFEAPVSLGDTRISLKKKKLTPSLPRAATRSRCFPDR